MAILTALTLNNGVRTFLNWLMPIVYGSIAALPALLTLFSDLDESKDAILAAKTGNDNKVYDFIVVGAGSAGAVVAHQLSKHFSVLVLERGGSPNPLSSVPQLAPALINYPEIDYMYRSIPQTSSCLSLNNRQSSWSRGRGLGGSSTINLMVYLRGHPQDYNHWANLTGDPRWSYDNLLPFFRRSENYCFECETNPNDPPIDYYYHNDRGPLSVGKPPYQPLVEEFLQGSEWNGIPRVDLNAPYSEGAAAVTYTQIRGKRHNTYDAFLKPIKHRRTLTIEKYARAYQILFKPNNEAYGIKYERHGRTQVAFAKKEVILSAGSLDSAKLLMLSGIGPRHHLESLGIRVRRDLPVGKNIQDHIGTFPGPFLVDRQKSFNLDRDVDLKNVLNFATNGTGTLTTTTIHANAFFSSFRAKANGEGHWPDTQWMFLGFGNSGNIDELYSHAFNVRLDVLKKFFEPVKGFDAFQITVMLSRPLVRGEMFLRSRNYKDDPIFNPKYFEDPDQSDIRVMVEGVKRAVYMSENAPAFKRLGSRLSPIPFPPCAHLRFRSDPYWECFVRHYSVSIYHYSGTTAMGPVGSPSSVVDSELRVIGCKRLRVIDAGIMPFVVTTNTNAPTIMIGQRGAQFVLDTWSNYFRGGRSHPRHRNRYFW